MARGGRSLLALLMLAFAGVGSYYAWTGPESPLAERVPLTVVATASPALPVEAPAVESSAPRVAPDAAVPPGLAPESVAPQVEVTPATPVAAPIIDPVSTPLLDAPRASDPTQRVVVVQERDTLYSIALAELGSGTRWSEIADANPQVDPSRLRVGDRLVIPAPGRGGEPSAPASHEVHVVAPGETLTSISRALWNDGSKWRRLLEANKALLEDDPDRLRVGDRLIVPAAR